MMKFNYVDDRKVTGMEYDAQHEMLLAKGKAKWGEDVNLLHDNIELDLD
jgi:hypothetical protein